MPVGWPGWGAVAGASGLHMHAVIEIPLGQTVGGIQLFGDDPSVAYDVFAVHVPTGKPTLLGSGTLGPVVNLQDYTASELDYLLVRRRLRAGRQAASEGSSSTRSSAASIAARSFDSVPDSDKWLLAWFERNTVFSSAA